MSLLNAGTLSYNTLISKFMQLERPRFLSLNAHPEWGALNPAKLKLAIARFSLAGRSGRLLKTAHGR